ncbi:DNA polymerase III subunit alpha [Candidatus Peregrinibacteria bacterium]|nr:DNA polymerase III subunit alpha [Candidatus Peregrinibacteria bacterium]
MSEKPPFVHLHLHSFYSLLDGLSRPEAYVKKAKEQGCPAIALTDHGVMHGAIEFYKACKKHGVKPIIGMEVYIAFNKLTDKRHQIDNKRTHATLLAKDMEGYKNLLKMATIANFEGFYYKPRVDWDLMKEHSKGIIALSGCLLGDIPQAVLNSDDNRIKELINRFQTTFGKDNFYLEVQYHPEIPQQQTVNTKLISLGKELNIPLVATEDCHYVNPEDNVAQDIMICIQSGKNLDDTNRMSMMNADYSMKDPSEIIEAFKDVPEAIENTVKIAERCNVEFEFGINHIPSFPLEDGKDPAEYLRELCYKGLIEKYKLDESKFKFKKGKIETKEEEYQKLADRLDYELQIIEDMGFVGYFLIVWDFVKWAKDQGIVVGPGRGSAAGALVSYTLDITEVDPLKYDLLFERFLNPARISMPDIDMDFADNRRDEVIDYVTQKYGRDRVAQICTFGTLAARAAVKDVGRTLGVPFSQMNEFAKLIPEKPGTTLEEALEKAPELTDAIKKEDIYKQVMENALKLEGAVRHVSVHACAVVIADEPLVNYTALQHPPKDEDGIITQYSAKPLEALGLLKMDFLGLKNLTILQTALKIIERTKGNKINLKKIPMDDKKAYALMARGETTGVFQLESAGMKRYLKELRPTEFEDIIAMVSLYRPGPMEWIPDYIAGKHGRKKTTYAHESLEPILRKTYGIAIYQEQILQIAQVFAGFSLGEADLLRRAIGKKIIKELEAQREKFLTGAIEKGHSSNLAVEIFEKVIEPFAGYGFNKSHAACYAMIAYQTAYLKAHYPTEFMTALMSADYGNTERIVIEIGECEQMGIKVLPPDVNESLSNFTYVEDGKIRFGLSAIKGLGKGSVKMIIESRVENGRPFESLEDFAKTAPSKILNKKTLESLAFGGAMESLGERRQIGLNYEKISEFAKTKDSSHQIGQAGLFDAMGDDAPIDHLELEKVEPATDSERLKWEKEYLGIYVSGHPLDGLQKYFQKKTIPLNQLEGKTLKKAIKVGGIITGLRKITTKKGDMMAIIQIEDAFGKAEAIAFPKTYAKVASIEEDQIILIDGILERRTGEMQIVINSVEAMTIEELKEKAKSENLYTEGEKVIRASRQDIQDDEVAEAEEALEIKEDEVSELASDSLFENPNAHQIVLNKEVDKDFFIKLKKLFDECPGKDDIELVIGEKVIPIPNKVNWEGCLKEKVNTAISEL